MSPVYQWALSIVRIGDRFVWAELQLAVNSFRKYGRCDLEGWAAA